MSFNSLYNEGTPTKIVIKNLGINVEPETNDNLNLSSEYLVVGENSTSTSSGRNRSISLIVDSRGFGVNTNLASRSGSLYDNEIHGKTLLSGNVRIAGSVTWDTVPGEQTSNVGQIFKYAYNGRGIYYDDTVTFGDIHSASNNSYTLNISKPARRNIDMAQFALQNSKKAVAKMAIIGESEFSPLIFNTSPNVPIEFHIGRDKAFFENAYTQIDYTTREPTIKDSDTPRYLDKLSSPHFNIDINGNVGIKTDFNPLFRFNIRDTDQYGAAVFRSNIFHPDLFVNGTTYSSNILTYDYETKSHKNLDELYARRNGQSVVLSNLSPGQFAKGFFEFQSNVSIMHDIDHASALMVGGNTSNTGDINVDGNVTSKKTLTTRTLDVEETATFNNNLYIKDNIFVKANIYKYVDTSNNEDKYEMLMINDNHVLNIQNGVTSDFVYYGNGYSTKGRFGVGIDITRAGEINNQLVVNKRDRKIFELELTDNNYLGFIKTAFIGHANTDYDNRNDGSLVFITPSPINDVYHQSQTNPKQNIYFYPGYEGAISSFTINSNNPPTLGMFLNKKIGIKTFDPKFDLDVTGDVAVTGNYYVKSKNNTYRKMGIWNDSTFGREKRYGGIFYYNEESPHVGINTVPKEEYGLTILGKVLSIDGYYTTDGLKTIPFYNSLAASNSPEKEYEYAYLRGRLGIGDFDSLGTLSVLETFPGSNTSLKLLNSSSGQHSTLHFVGNANEYIQMMNDTDCTFEILNGSSNDLFNRSLSRALITKKYPNGSNQLILNSNIAYGLEKHNAALVVNGDVDINGDLNITGNYKISSRAIEITAGEPAKYYNVPDTSDNVYITGENIQLNTNTYKNGALYIGWGNNVVDSQYNALVNIALNTTVNARLEYIAKFSSLSSTTSLTQYKCNSGNTAVVGILDNKFFIGENINAPYITVGKTLLQNNTMGIGTYEPDGSRLHIYNDINGQSLLSLTRYNAISDNNGTYSDISLEKKIGRNSYKWAVHAPVLSGNTQKLQFLYKDTVNAGYCNMTEKVCITKDGFIGINSIDPKYALDINGVGLAGSIRMRQSTDISSRQNLVFQSGDAEYGSDLLMDYSIYAFSNTFSIESCDVSGEHKIFHVGSNNTIGLNQVANDEYSVSINGKLNVSDSIYINGRTFFSVLDNNLENGSFLEWKNIFINPETIAFGGVSINGGITPSSNVFQVNSGSNGNVAVFNSIYPHSLVHFRNLHRNPESQDNERIWRTGSYNNSFIFEYCSNVVYNETLITDSSDNYARVVEYIQSSTTGEFIQHLNGSIELVSVNPSFTMNSQNIFGTSNDHMYIMTSNFGIGTHEPLSKFDIENNDLVTSLNITHTNTTCNIVAINTDNFVITHSGDVGIGTSNPEAKIHIVGSTKFENSGNTTFEVVGDSIFRNNLTVKGNVVNDSDFRIKTDVKVIEEALSKIKKISGYTFIKNGVSSRETGVIAQEIKEVLPEAVFEHDDGLLGVAYGNMIGLLIEGIKELSDKIDDIYLKIDR